MYRLQQQLKNLKQQIKLWNKSEFGNIFQAKKQLQERMKQNQHQMIASGCSQELIEEEVSLMAQIETRDKHEEILWRQKSRILWLQEGERNSKFFHNSMIQRRHQNKIISLKYQQGNKLSNHQDIQSELLQYYKTLMQEPQLNRKDAIKNITQHIPKMINENHNEALMRPVTMEEVEQVIWEMSKGKSPGPDGFTVDFYQACWPVIKNEVWEAVEDSRNSKKSSHPSTLPSSLSSLKKTK
jgi:hypothetical protein